MTVAVLFARADSIYKTMPGLDVFDAARDARTWGGGVPVVAHPPCRAWGRLRWNAKPRPDEKQLAVWAVDMVRAFGGVLEHPAGSTLWAACNLPWPGQGADKFGGWTLPIAQSWFGHRAEKRTFLYVVGCGPDAVPRMPMLLGQAERVIGCAHGRRAGDPGWRPHVTKQEREATPEALARWLVELARGCAK